MLVLALDTATAATSVAVVALDPDGSPRVLAQRQHVDPRAHGEVLAPLVIAALAEAGAGPPDLSAIVAGTGPGPFTGLRIGIVTATVMGQALGLPTYGVCSLDGIGAGPPDPDGSGPGWPGPDLVATDARRREVYWAVYQQGQRVSGPAVDRPADLLPAVAQHGLRRAYGEGARRYQDVLGLPVEPAPRYPDPARLVAVAAQRLRSGAPGERLVPRYLRRPDATEPAAAPGAVRS